MTLCLLASLTTSALYAGRYRARVTLRSVAAFAPFQWHDYELQVEFIRNCNLFVTRPQDICMQHICFCGPNYAQAIGNNCVRWHVNV